MVLDLPLGKYVGSTVSFFAGLLDWNSMKLPKDSNIRKCKLLECGNAHVGIIERDKQHIIGKIDLEDSEVKIPEMVTSAMYCESTKVIKAYTIIRKASPDDCNTMKCCSTWGLDVIKLYAQKYFLGNFA